MSENGFARLGVIGDVHARDDRLEPLLDQLTSAGVDRLVCVGDIVTGPGSPDRCVQLLQAHDVLTVRGNHDRWLLEGVRVGNDAHSIGNLEASTVDFIRSLPTSARLVAHDGTRVLLCHGLADNDMNRICPDDFGYALDANDDLQRLLVTREPLVIVKGHRHEPAIWRIERLTLIDAGSLLDHSETCGLILDFYARTAIAFAVEVAAVSIAPGVRFN